MSSICLSLVEMKKELSSSRLFALMLFILFMTAVLWCSFTASSLHFGLVASGQVGDGLALLDSFDPLKEAVVMDGAATTLTLVAVVMIVIVVVLVNVQKDGATHNARLVFVERKLLRLCDPILQTFRRGILHSQVY